MNTTKFASLLIGLVILLFSACRPQSDFKVLVFSKTEGFRHSSIPKGIKTIQKLGEQNGFEVTTTEDASFFEQKNLKNYQAVIFLNTTGNVLNDLQQQEFERYIQAGGGYLGVHSAADTEHEWDWYGRLVGGYFKNHPKIQNAAIDVLDNQHLATKHLGKRWETTDEWYNYLNLNTSVNVLMKLDETSYEGGENGDNHPIAWSHEYDGGRAFYTGLGHTEEQYDDETFLQHLLGAIQWTGGDLTLPDYNKVSVAPENNRFKKVVLDNHFHEPMELEILPDESVLFIERGGNIKRHKDGITKDIAQLNVYYNLEEGLMGVVLDPNFKENQWIYFFYSTPEDTLQNLSRFTMAADYNSIDMTSEKVILQVKTQRRECCHSGGSIEFDAQGNLYLSTGDNTNPFASDGFSPSDERAGRTAWDAQRTSANSQDLRGKILRITPQSDGTYTIPAGNLFADEKEGRPEIYIMGCRNPFRISIDSHTGFLYWGEVGPDAGTDDASRGARGHDEVNQARKAGFFGWPLFVANNKPYKKYDFETLQSGEPNDVQNPINNSVNNTGIQELPAAQPAFIWYPYAGSKEFPLLKNGGRNAMAGEVFYVDDYEKNPRRFPSYFDKKLFIYDWMRGWVMAVTMDKNGDYERMEQFMPNHKFNNPIDMKFSPKGDLYILEYGTTWNEKNEDAQLVRIEYTGGNRQPVAQLKVDKTIGGLPFTAKFDGTTSSDFDGEDLTFSWKVDGESIETVTPKLEYTFEEAGKHEVTLTVKDASKLENSTTVILTAGNELAVIDWKLEGNQDFFWSNQPVNYEVKVSDKEDGSLEKGIEKANVSVDISYLAEGKDIVQSALGHQITASGKSIMDKSDCQACHQKDVKSSGPAYTTIAEKYKNDKNAITYLGQKIIKGGNGVWGETAMAAHPNLTNEEAEDISKYILSLAKMDSKKTFPVAGIYQFQSHKKAETDGKYIFRATYNDKGANGISSFLSEKIHILRQPFFTATDFLDKKKVGEGKVKIQGKEVQVLKGKHGGYIHFGRFDLTDIQSLTLMTNTNPKKFAGGSIELRLDAPDGQLWGTAKLPISKETGNVYDISNVKMKALKGKYDLYLVFKSSQEGDSKEVGVFCSLSFNN
jgi:cytochrome c